MDNNDEKDEKRRVMTPPAEWGGDSADDDFLGGDSGWLSDPDDNAAEDPAGAAETTSPLQDNAEAEGASEDGGVPLETVAGEPESTEAAEPEIEAEPEDKPAPKTDDSDLGWLTSDDMALSDEEPATDSTTTKAATNAATDATTDDAPTLLDDIASSSVDEAPGTEAATAEAEPAPADEPLAESDEDDNWLDDAGDLAMAPMDDEEPALSVTPVLEEPSEPAPAPEPIVMAAAAEAENVDSTDNSDGDADWMSEPDDPAPAEPALPPTPAASAPASSSEALLTDHKVAQEMPARRLPLWPIVAVVIALILVGAGGWGAYTERTQLQARVAELEGQIARMRKQGDLSPEEEQALRSDNQSLRLQLATLREQYAGMAAEIENLEQRMLNTVGNVADSAQAATSVAVEPEPEVSEAEEVPEPVAQPKPEPAAPTATTATAKPATKISTGDMPTTTDNGGWFVNIASYSRLDIAEEWANRVRQVADHVTLQDIEVNGKTLHRVRVVGYASKADAQAAAKVLESQYKTGPLWIGEIDPNEAVSAPKAQPVAEPTVSSAPSAASEPAVQAQPVTLKTSTDNGGWFIYVDTYSRGVDADTKAKQIGDAGYEAKVAVEYRSGELFYRVQVVGIDSREIGERIVEELAALGDMPNLQLRQY